MGGADSLSGMRPHRLLGTSAIAVLTVAALAACGSQGASAPGTSFSPSASTPAGGDGAGATTLTIAVTDGPDSTPQTWTLTCEPAGGNHPDPAAACASLASAEDPFKPVDKNLACTEIYGGAQTATVTGTFDGEPVNASLSRTNGCEIARWEAIQPALILQGGA